MKTSAYVKELQAQSVEQLQAQLVDAKKELFNLRFQKMCIRDRSRITHDADEFKGKDFREQDKDVE